MVDRSAFIETVRECGCADCTVVADKGFYSKTNLSALMEAGLRFILPLQSNTRMLDDAFVADPDDHKFDSAFSYHSRVIWHKKLKSGTNGNWIYIFRDDERRQQLQTRMVERIEKSCGEGVEEEKPMDILEQRRTGYYAMVSNIDTDAKEILLSYKARWDIEQCFDYLKNEGEQLRCRVVVQVEFGFLGLLRPLPCNLPEMRDRVGIFGLETLKVADPLVEDGLVPAVDPGPGGKVEHRLPCLFLKDLLDVHGNPPKVVSSVYNNWQEKVI